AGVQPWLAEGPGHGGQDDRGEDSDEEPLAGGEQGEELSEVHGVASSMGACRAAMSARRVGASGSSGNLRAKKRPEAIARGNSSIASSRVRGPSKPAMKWLPWPSR